MSAGNGAATAAPFALKGSRHSAVSGWAAFYGSRRPFRAVYSADAASLYGFAPRAFGDRRRYPGGGGASLRCRVVKRDHHGRCISSRNARRYGRHLRAVRCRGVQRGRMTRLGFLVRIGDMIARDRSVPRSWLGPQRAGRSRRGRRHRVTPAGFTVGWPRPGCRGRVANGRSIGAPHIDRRWFDRIVRAGSEKTTGRDDRDTNNPGPDSPALPHCIPLWRYTHQSSPV